MGPEGPSGCGAVTVSSTFQDLAEPDPLETEAAPASKAAKRAASPSTDCSMFEFLFVIDATDCVSDKILF